MPEKETNPARRVRSIIRNFVYLKSDYIIIYDQIQSLSEDFEKRWLLHSGDYQTKDGKPVVAGAPKILHGTEEAGVTEFYNKDYFSLQNKEGYLSVKVLLPKDNILRRIGGKEFEFWVNGENYALSNIPKNRTKENPGAWRMEVSGKEKSKDSEFLVVMKPNRIPENDLSNIIHIRDQENTLQGVKIPVEDSFVHVFFLNPDTSINGTFDFKSDGRTIIEDCVLLGLKPDMYTGLPLKTITPLADSISRKEKDLMG